MTPLDIIGFALPGFVWAFPAISILYFRVWPAAKTRDAAQWSVISPFVSVVIPLTIIVGIVYQFDLIRADITLMFAVAFAAECVMFWWAIAERDRLATPSDRRTA